MSKRQDLMRRGRTVIAVLGGEIWECRFIRSRSDGRLRLSTWVNDEEVKITVARHKVFFPNQVAAIKERLARDVNSAWRPR